jgi:hypothetical protein
VLASAWHIIVKLYPAGPFSVMRPCEMAVKWHIKHIHNCSLDMQDGLRVWRGRCVRLKGCGICKVFRTGNALQCSNVGLCLGTSSANLPFRGQFSDETVWNGSRAHRIHSQLLT